METVRVNMTPNNEVKTIHCSQNDGNTRKWGFELYKEDGVIDGSSIKEQMLFNAYKGGTEQILPENTSTPATSPIIADIQYKDALRSEQEFLYRESPATEDGQARITKIKGNTVKFNQLVQNGNFVDATGWGGRQSSVSVSDNIITVTPSSTGTERGLRGASGYEIACLENHKYYISIEVKPPINSTVVLSIGGANPREHVSLTANTWNKASGILAYTSAYTNTFYALINESLTTSQSIQYKKAMFTDLTAMGIDNLTTTSEVEAWLSSHIGNLPYYDYNPGSLLSFNGTGLKTTGKNLFDKSTPISRGQYQSGEWYNINNRITTDFIRIIPNINYTMFVDLDRSADLSFVNYNYFDGNKVWLGDRNTNGDTSLGGLREKTFNIHNDSAMYIKITFWKDTDPDASIATQTLQDAYFQLQLGSAATSYTPYISSTINLPVLDHFPTGMKKNGTIFDELLENKSIRRLGMIVIDGSVDPVTARYNEGRCFYDVADISTWSETTVIDTTVLSNYLPQSSNALTVGGNQGIHRRSNGSHQICVGLGVALGLSDLTAWNAYLAGHPLTVYYELDSYVETDITTASLVTEKGEAPLYYDDGLIADCNETISSESGIFDAKIKVVDSETVYSQKINLHVENNS